MFRTVLVLTVAAVLSGCTSTASTSSTPSGTAQPTLAPTAQSSASSSCTSATLTILNRRGDAVGIAVNGVQLGSVEANSTRTLDSEGMARTPPLPWVAVMTDPSGSDLGSVFVPAGVNASATVTDALWLDTAAAMRAGCPVTPNPYAGAPSNACGGFHLKVVNETNGAVTVSLNGAWTSELASGSSQVINQAFSSPRPPAPPWYVVITDASGRSIFQGIADPGDSGADQKVILSDGAGPIQAPYDLSEDC